MGMSSGKTTQHEFTVGCGCLRCQSAQEYANASAAERKRIAPTYREEPWPPKDLSEWAGPQSEWAAPRTTIIDAGHILGVIAAPWQNNYIPGYWRCCEGEPIEPQGYCGLCGTDVTDAPYSFWLGADSAHVEWWDYVRRCDMRSVGAAK